MSRVVPLPALVRAPGMLSSRETSAASESAERQEPQCSIPMTSNREGRILSADFILVYDRSRDEESETSVDVQRKKVVKSSERRRRFENYLRNRQGLILEHMKSTSKRLEYVKVHTPFETLLITAENMRMRLPIERIENDEEDVSNIPANQSIWFRMYRSLKKPFLLDSSLKKNDPDYYTAIYSSNVKKFEELFETLRGSKDLYFTPTERSLLTYELLSRAQFEFEDEEEENLGGVPNGRPDTTVVPRKTLKRHGIDRLITKKAYECYFPLHEPLRDKVTDIDDAELNDREKLKKHWATLRHCMKFQPLSLIRSYMGEKVAFYFALCGFYNKWLILPALVGVIIFLYGIGSVFSDRPTSDICDSFGQNTNMCPRCDKNCDFWKLSDSCVYSKISYVFDNTATVIFAILISLWARLFVEFWKRHQSALQYDWDSINFEEHFEPIRPDFEAKASKIGEERVNPVTGIKEPYMSPSKRIPFFLIASGVVLAMMGIVCATVFGTIAYRVRMDVVLKNSSASAYSSIIITVTSAIINLICSIILSQFYYWIARKLTNLELHKYQSKYDDSLTIKIYLFQFVNFYSSLFYVAFFKGRFLEYPTKYGESGSGDYTEQCDPAGCLVELSIQLVIIMVGKQIINNFLEFFAAMSRTLTRKCFQRKENVEEAQWEKDNQLFDFKSDTLIDEYLELVIQFGFITLFVTAFPLAPLFALCNNIIELRLDAWKFLSKYKRPIPHKAADIGIWSDVMSGISYFAVLTNAVVIAWTSEFIPKMSYRSLQSTGGSLDGYVNWTLSYFPIADYNVTATVIPSSLTNITYCRYRDFRETTGPFYSQTAVYWNVTAARLAFIIVFEHVIFFIIYLIQWLVSDVPSVIQNKIDHERYIDQRERWGSKTTEDHLRTVAKSSALMFRVIESMDSNMDRDIYNRRTPSTKSRRQRNSIAPGSNNSEL